MNFPWHLRSPGRRLRVREAAVDGTRDSLQVMQGDQGQRSTADTSGKLAARDGVLLVQGIFSGDGGSS